jgi:hypothetical protein
MNSIASPALGEFVAFLRGLMRLLGRLMRRFGMLVQAGRRRFAERGDRRARPLRFGRDEAQGREHGRGDRLGAGRVPVDYEVKVLGAAAVHRLLLCERLREQRNDVLCGTLRPTLLVICGQEGVKLDLLVGEPLDGVAGPAEFMGKNGVNGRDPDYAFGGRLRRAASSSL